MELRTIPQIAEALNLSVSRLRVIMCRKNAPTPVIQPRYIGQGRSPGKYDLDEVRKFYEYHKYRRNTY